MQKYELSRQTHKMTIYLRLGLYKILFYTARIAYENTYDMRGALVLDFMLSFGLGLYAELRSKVECQAWSQTKGQAWSKTKCQAKSQTSSCTV